ncbi:hypothetical protein ACFL0N_00280 [Pseudomonadota bacterium]
MLNHGNLASAIVASMALQDDFDGESGFQPFTDFNNLSTTPAEAEPNLYWEPCGGWKFVESAI